jgi:anthranilate phosphoribosyltransferase
VSGTVGSLEEGVRAAEAAIDDGRAAAALDALASLTRELSAA